jgi:hypothetical protein
VLLDTILFLFTDSIGNIMSKKGLISAIILSQFIGVAPAFSGPYADQLARCLIESTTATDRQQLVRWMFSAASKHPAVQELVKVSDTALEDANKSMGILISRLLTDSCKSQTIAALKFEGNSTIESSFSVLGQVAGRELFSDPNVAQGMASIDKYIDSDAIQALIPAQ